MLGFSFYFIALEVIKYRHQATAFGLFLLGFHFLVVISFALNYVEGGAFYENSDISKIDYFIIVGSVLIIMSYFIFLLYLRIFEPFAVLINLIFYAMKETATYILIFLIAIMGFANALFILAMLE